MRLSRPARATHVARIAGVVAVSIGLAQCSSAPSNPTPGPAPLPPVTPSLTGAGPRGGTSAPQQSGSPPPANGGPSVTVTTGPSVTPNLPDEALLEAAAQFQTVYVSVANTSGVAALIVSPTRVA